MRYRTVKSIITGEEYVIPLEDQEPIAELVASSSVTAKLDEIAKDYAGEDPVIKAVRLQKREPDLFEQLDPNGKAVLEVIEIVLSESKNK